MSAYRSALKLFGAAHLSLGLWWIGQMIANPPLAYGWLCVLVLLGVGALLASDMLCPNLLARPRRWYAILAAMVLLSILGAATCLSGIFIGNVLDRRGGENMFLLGAAPGALLTLASLTVLPLVARFGRPTDTGAKLDGGGTISSWHRINALARRRADAEELAAPDRGWALVLSILEAVSRALCCLLATITMALWLRAWWVNHPSFDLLTLDIAIGSQVMAAAIVTIVTAFAALPLKIVAPRILRPRSGREASGRAFAIFTSGAIAYVLAPRLAAIGMWPTPLLPLVDHLQPIVVAAVLLSSLTGFLLARTGPRLEDLYAALDQGTPIHADSDLPRVVRTEKAKTPKRLKAPTEAKIPALGFAMKLYVIADWVVLRALGAGLVGTGYMLQQMMAAGRTSRVEPLVWGQEPLHALWAYYMVGALLLVPVLLPRWIARPCHVAGGLAKAALLVVVGFLLMRPLEMAIILYTDDMYHATLAATVPRLFKATAGVAITAALITSFFRQLGTSPRQDHTGRPIEMLSADELRKMRHGRMPAA